MLITAGTFDEHLNQDVKTSDDVTHNSLALTGSFEANVVSKTGAYTATSSDYIILCDTSGGSFTITLPATSGIKTIYHIKKTDSSGNTITVDADGSETIDGSLTKVINIQYDSMMIVSDGSNWHIV